MSAQAGSSEVSKKLKAAIRAKLEELGVYVDDELPDYIMVMIANKKEKTQMKDDLSLFIGKSTAKFVDWLFDLFDRLQNASSKQGESSKKEEEKKKESEAKEHEENQRKEKENRDREMQREKEREKEKEREREKERQKERDREKRLEDEKRREEKRKEIQKNKRRRTRSRSNTYSDTEDNTRQRKESDRHRDRGQVHKDHRARSSERKRVASTVVRHPSASPERQKVHSTVVVKRNIRPSGDSSSNVKARGSMFLRAMNEASVSAGYGPVGRNVEREEKQEADMEDDDMSDVDALPSKTTKSPKKSIKERLSRIVKDGKETSKTVEPMQVDDAVFLDDQTQTGGPQMILKLTGGKEAIKRTRIQDRIVIDDSLRRGLLKRKVEASGEPKSKHERIVFDISGASRDSTPTDDSPTMRKWDGQIKLSDDSDSDDEEAEIDAFVAEARGIARHDSIREEEDELRPTHTLSGGSFGLHVPHYQQAVPTYIPTPLSVLQEQQNQLLAPAKEDHHVKEKCIFWPKCTKGDACAFMHPTKNCTNFPNCTYGTRCLFIHPPCRFDRYCTKKHCPFTHHGTGGVQTGQAVEATNPLTSNRVFAKSNPVKTVEELPKPAARGALGSLAEKLAASLKKKTSQTDKSEAKAETKTDENEKSVTEPEAKNEDPTKNVNIASNPSAKTLPEIAPLQSMIPCRYSGGCRNPSCHFKHPKECRFGSNCRNASCYFYHKPTAPIAVTTAPTTGDVSSAKYKWTASS